MNHVSSVCETRTVANARSPACLSHSFIAKPFWQGPPDDEPGDWMGMGSAGRGAPSSGGPARAAPGGAACGAARGGAVDENEDDDEELLAMQRESAWVR